MRAIVQRVKYAKMNINNRLYSSIKQGLIVYLAIHEEDDDSDLEYMVRKVLGLRIFDDDNNIMNLSVKDVNADIMIVSQFTLYGDVRKGNRPNYMQSAKGHKANNYYEKFIQEIESRYKGVATGVFGADMQIEYINDGPVTIQLDSSKLY